MVIKTILGTVELFISEILVNLSKKNLNIDHVRLLCKEHQSVSSLGFNEMKETVKQQNGIWVAQARN